MEYNVYCDESCHLENDGIDIMGIGGVWCPKDKTKEISNRIRELKLRHDISTTSEIKWTKVTPAKVNFYIDLINFFFDYQDLHFRMIIVDKTQLDHKRFNQTHDQFYYKMYFDMLSFVFERDNKYNVYVDIKDTKSYQKCLNLEDVCCNSRWDFAHQMIQKVRPIRSDESQIMQLADILIGAVMFRNRTFPKEHIRSTAKNSIVNKIKERSGYRLNKTNYLTERKFNLFFWEAK
ncbi:MAG: DUF3800 domain-containing protein [Anaeroplasma sp.]